MVCEGETNDPAKAALWRSRPDLVKFDARDTGATDCHVIDWQSNGSTLPEEATKGVAIGTYTVDRAADLSPTLLAGDQGSLAFRAHLTPTALGSFLETLDPAISPVGTLPVLTFSQTFPQNATSGLAIVHKTADGFTVTNVLYAYP